jgi:putative transcriptional regulator
MPIKVRLNVVMAERNVKSKDLAEHVGISLANLSLLKQGKVRGVRFGTLEKICEFLKCQPGDILRLEPMDGHPNADRPIVSSVSNDRTG